MSIYLGVGGAQKVAIRKFSVTFISNSSCSNVPGCSKLPCKIHCTTVFALQKGKLS